MAISYGKIGKRLAAFGLAALMIGGAGVASVSYADVGVSVSAASVTRLTLDKTTGEAVVGVYYLLKAQDKISNTNEHFNWQSSDTSIATVDNHGRVMPKKLGTVTITVSNDSGEKASCKLKVMKGPSSITLSKSSVTLGLGESCTIEMSTSPSGTAKENIKVSNIYRDDYFTLSQSGNKITIKAKKAGWDRITAEGYDKSATCEVYVKPAPTSVKLSKSEVTIGVGEIVDLYSTINEGSASNTRKYTSSDSSIAEIIPTSWNCKFKAKKPGTTYINVRTHNGKTAKCKVTVKPAPTKVSVTKTQITMGVGEKASLGSNINAGSCSTKRTYRTSNSSIVKMTKTNWVGEFTAVKPGTAWVTVRTHNGKEASCKITVKPAPTNVYMNKKTITLKVGQTGSVSSYLNSGAASSTRTYKTYDSNVLKMTKTNWEGQFKALNPGVTYVSVMTHNGKKAYCKVVVTGGNLSANAQKEIKVGETINDFRVSNGVDPLSFEKNIVNAARTKVNDVAKQGNYYERNADGTTVPELLKKFGVSYNGYYQLFTVGYDDYLKPVKDLLKSNRSAALDKSIKKMGIGLTYVGKNSNYYTHDYIIVGYLVY